MKRAWTHIREVERLGGMTRAISQGLPKARIEEAAARRQARIDSGCEVIVGVNKFRLQKEELINTRDVDNTAVRESQLAQLRRLKSERDNASVQLALDALTQAAAGAGNLLALAVDAARVRATLGEISFALEKVWGRHTADTRSITGIYRSEFGEETRLKWIRQMTDDFALHEGRRPRILIAKMGQDGHDRGARVVASAYGDLGFDVDIGPLFQTPAETAKQAVENDSHIVGVSSLAAGHKTLVPQLIAELKALGRDDIIVVVGGVIPPKDYDFLFKAGAAAIFGPGTVIPDAAEKILKALEERLGIEYA
jgi:methylmalonyl-CoA mutase